MSRLVVYVTVALLQIIALLSGEMAVTYALEGVGLHPALSCLLAWAAGLSFVLILLEEDRRNRKKRSKDPRMRKKEGPSDWGRKATRF